MPDELRYDPVTTDDEIRIIARLIHLAFGSPPGECETWVGEKIGRENLRLIRRAGEPLACLGRVPMGISLGGRSIPQIGVLGVTVGPEARGGGVARWMMRECVREMHRDGFALSTLYSALHPLYRGVGYENAGVLTDLTVPAAMMPEGDKGRGWRRMTPEDRVGVEGCYGEYARAHHGMLDRPDYIWDRVRTREGETTGFVALDDAGAIEAYCFVVMGKMDGPPCGTGTGTGAPLRVTDLAWRTPRGMGRLMGFLRGFASIVGEVRLSLPAGSALPIALPDWRFAMKVRTPWMMRVLDVPRALEGRGYAAGVRARVTIEIEDDLIGSNNGAWTLSVEEGVGRVERGGGAGSVRCSIRDFAPLYSGHCTAAALRSSGRLECDAAAAALCDAVFSAGGSPGMVDMF
jgi:predicted acetyltransferase